MQKLTLLSTAALLSVMTFQASGAAQSTDCAVKKANIERQISYARQHGNTHRVNGLNKALGEISEHCTDADLLTARKNKIAEKEKKVAGRQQELADAQTSGKADKVTKKRQKLKEAEQELKDAQAELLK